MNYIDYYVLRATGDPQDFEAAIALGDGWDADFYMESIRERFKNGKLSPVREDGDELKVINGEEVLIIQYHNGVSDGGSHDIANTKWVAEEFPEAYKLLGISVSGGTGVQALIGEPAWTF